MKPLSIVTNAPCEVSRSEADAVDLGYPTSNGGSWSRRTTRYCRLTGNVFSTYNFSSDEFDLKLKSFLILREGKAMEMYRPLYSQGGLGCIVISAEESDLKSLKKTAKTNAEAFDLKKILGQIQTINQALKIKQKAAKQAATFGSNWSKQVISKNRSKDQQKGRP